MSFQSLGFLAFLMVTLAVCLPAGRRSPRAGAALLTIASAVFYLLGPGGWTAVLGGLACLLLGIAVTAWAIRRMARSGSRRRTLALACVYHIAVLVGFKYTEFLTGGAVEVGWAPLGLSFFTFQQLWLLKEVYTGEYVPAPGDSLLLYGLFFPTVTSGPILRPDTFFPQLRGESFLRPDWPDAAAGVYPLATASHDFRQTLFHVSQCARAACRKGQTCRLCGTDQCRPCQERWELLDDLSDALERNAFQLYVQFFVDAATFRVVGGEALSRWYHPRLGLLNPSRYVPLLEETGQIERLDLYGLEQACGFLEDLRAHQVQDFFISCNFSRMTFSAPDFARRCVQVVQRYTFPRKFLILEVTESQQMASCEMERLRQNIRAVRENGMRVIFDDFGAGFSSFRDLQACPMDGLKLDKELVDHMQTEKGQIILKALVEVGHRMGLTILAEGVEDERQIALLQKLHCDAFQGFRFAVPLPAAEAKSRILRGDRSLQDRAHDPGQTAPPAGSGRESGRRPGKSKEP